MGSPSDKWTKKNLSVRFACTCAEEVVVVVVGFLSCDTVCAGWNLVFVWLFLCRRKPFLNCITLVQVETGFLFAGFYARGNCFVFELYTVRAWWNLVFVWLLLCKGNWIVELKKTNYIVILLVQGETWVLCPVFFTRFPRMHTYCGSWEHVTSTLRRQERCWFTRWPGENCITLTDCWRPTRHPRSWSPITLAAGTTLTGVSALRTVTELAFCLCFLQYNTNRSMQYCIILAVLFKRQWCTNSLLYNYAIFWVKTVHACMHTCRCIHTHTHMYGSEEGGWTRCPYYDLWTTLLYHLSPVLACKCWIVTSCTGKCQLTSKVGS